MKRRCMECEEMFTGRSDAKFCSDHCRSSYHNQHEGAQLSCVRQVNNILRKNRKILAELNPEGKARVNRTELLRYGFNFSYFTNTYCTKTGKEYRFCYEQGYLNTNNEWFQLVVKHEYV